MNVAPNPLLSSVIDGSVDRVRIPDLLVGLQFVGIDGGGIVGNDSVQERGDLTLAVAASLAESKLPAALDSAKNGGFVSAPVETFLAASPASLTVLLGGLEFAADESLVSLHNAHQQGSLGLHHGRADAVAEIPSGLVTDAEHPLELIGADTFLGLAHDVGSHEPLPQRKVGVVENRARHDRKLVAASVTVELIPLVHAGQLGGLTAGADRPFRPAQLFQHHPALLIGPEVIHEGDKA